MSKNITRNILWIDDDPARENTYKRVVEGAFSQNVVLQFQCVESKSLFGTIDALPVKPDLIIIDHFLAAAQHDKNSGIPTGISAAIYLRQKWSDCPIIGVTADNNSDKDDFDKTAFEMCAYNEIIFLDRFSDSVSFLPIITNGFQQVGTIRNLEEIKGLLGLADTDENDNSAWEQVCSTLPESVTTDLNKKLYTSRFYLWFRNTFFKNAGFLYDHQWLSTFLGIKIDDSVINKYIERHGADFDAMRYKGVFSHAAAPRWWRHKLQAYIFSQSSDHAVTSQTIAQSVFQVAEEDRSVCYKSQEKLPDVLAYVDQSSLQQVQVCRRHTEPHPTRPFVPFYEEPRIVID